MTTPIDLAAVAERINALDGWTARIDDDMNGVFTVQAMYLSGETLTIWADGDVLTYEWELSLMPVLPVLQIVAEARGE